MKRKVEDLVDWFERGQLTLLIKVDCWCRSDCH